MVDFGKWTDWMTVFGYFTGRKAAGCSLRGAGCNLWGTGHGLRREGCRV